MKLHQLWFCTVLVMLISAPVLAKTKVVWGILDREYPPFIIDTGDKISGTDYDLTIEAFKRMNDYEVEIKRFPIARLPNAFASGQVDFLYSYKSPQWSINGEYLTQPLRWSSYRILTLPGKEFPYESMADLRHKSIGIVKAVPVSPIFYKADQDGELNLVRLPGFGVLVEMLIKGRVDAVLSNPDVIKAYAKTIDQKLTMLDTLPAPTKGFIGIISKRSKLASEGDFKMKFVKVLKQMHEDGTYQRIAKDYGVELQFHHLIE